MKTIVENLQEDITLFHQHNPLGIVVIWGATATGKSSTSMEVARHLPCEIISSDSRQIFRGMDIGTDKISPASRNEIPHHQIDIIDPDGFYTAGQWKRDVSNLIPQIQSRGRIPLIVGGTGLYIDTLYKNYSVPEVASDFTLRDQWNQLEEKEPGILRKRLQAIDPVEAKKHHPNSTRYIIRALEIYEKTGLTKSDAAKEQPVQRPMLMIGLWRSREDSNQRIAKRVGEMITSGLLEEVQGLLAKGYSPALQAMQGIGYKEIIQYLEQQRHTTDIPNTNERESSKQQKPMTLEKLQELITIHTQQYAKRQRTWFRRYISDAEIAPKEHVTYKVYTLD